MKLYYGIKDKPKFPQLVIYAIQQLLAIMAATLVVPIIIGNGMQPSAALFGAAPAAAGTAARRKHGIYRALCPVRRQRKRVSL